MPISKKGRPYPQDQSGYSSAIGLPIGRGPGAPLERLLEGADAGATLRGQLARLATPPCIGAHTNMD
eukprot:9504096-Pyramimonas_sp.AAC.4